MSAHKQSLLERLLYPYFRRFLATHEQAQYWTKKRCPHCATPVIFEQANFCHICSASLIPPVPALPVAPEPVAVPDRSPVTDGLYKLNMRPMDTYNAKLRQGTGVHTAITEAINIEKLRKNSKGFKS